VAGSAVSLLRSAAQAHIGVDRRLIHAILDQGPAAAADLAAFSRADHNQDRVNLDSLLVDLVRSLGAPEGFEVLLDVIRRNPEEIEEEIIEALLPFRERAVEPLLRLYEEVGEERGSDLAFLIAGLHIRDPRILAMLQERLEFDAADGAFLLGLYGDPAARPALEKMLAEIPEGESELRREFTYALELIAQAPPQYQPEPFDIYSLYPEHELPDFDLLPEPERFEMLSSPDPEIRGGAAYSFFNSELDPRVRRKLLELAAGDPGTHVRARAWEALGDAADDAAVRDAMLAVLTDLSKPVEERGGAAVGLYAAADRDEVRKAIEALYEEGGEARVKALEAMWRSLWHPFAKYFPANLDSNDPALLRQVLRGLGYFEMTRYAEQIASFFDRDDELSGLREDALFAYALAMPGQTTRGRIRGMFRKIDSLTRLSAKETDLVMFALDERLRLHGLEPVFAAYAADSDEDRVEENAPAPSAAKVGRNDPCPCGSGKKYKKCHGA
jgi:hypothetical protein